MTKVKKTGRATHLLLQPFGRAHHRYAVDLGGKNKVGKAQPSDGVGSELDRLVYSHNWVELTAGRMLTGWSALDEFAQGSV
jgi:hypothetical protein